MYKISKLSNGIRVVTEYTDYVKSVSVGVWVGAGSSLECAQNNGVSHFIEHMMFKGTKKRSAKEIAEFMDRVGGQLNALTAKEYTCYYAKTLTEHLDMSVEILSDMLKNSTFAEENIETERRVILEEINMSEDTPEDYIHDCLSSLMWCGNSLGYPIAGTARSLDGIDRAAMLDYYSSLYRGGNIVISVVGNFDEGELTARLEKAFGDIGRGAEKTPAQGMLSVVRGADIVKKDIEQCHACIGMKGVSRNDSAKYDLSVVNALFGGNMSSRLFQSVREERGLAYSVYSYMNTYHSNGSLVIYAGLNAENVRGAMEIINSEIRRLKRDKLTADEVETAKGQMKASIVMGFESVSSRMSSYGKSVLFEDRVTDIDEIIRKIDRVNKNTVADVIDRVFDSDTLNVALMGRIDGNGRDIVEILDF